MGAPGFATLLLHRPAVSPRAPAERPLSPVLSDWRGGDWAERGGERISRGRCRSSGNAGHAARPFGDSGLGVKAELGRFVERPAALFASVARRTEACGSHHVRRLRSEE